MSYILDALKKSDAERKRAQQHLNDDDASVSSLSAEDAKKPWAGFVAGGFGVVAIVGIGTYFAMHQDVAVLSSPPTAPPAAAASPMSPQEQEAKAVEPRVEPTVPPVVEPVVEPIIKVEQKAPAKPTLVTEPKPEPKAEPKTKIAAEVVAKTAPLPVRTPSLPPLKTANAYVDRAWQSMDTGLYGQALSDLDLALKQEPAFAKAWFAHGWANEKNGSEKAAISDYNHAIDAQPGYAFALFSRGFLNLYNGNLQAASVDFVRTQGVATDETLRLYSHLWLYITRQRLGQNAGARIRDEFKQDDLSVWPGPLIRYFQGTMDEQAIVNIIETSTDDVLKERRATGYFFLGMFEQMTGNNHNARIYFEKTLSTGSVQYRQYDAAGRELKRLSR